MRWGEREKRKREEKETRTAKCWWIMNAKSGIRLVLFAVSLDISIFCASNDEFINQYHVRIHSQILHIVNSIYEHTCMCSLPCVSHMMCDVRASMLKVGEILRDCFAKVFHQMPAIILRFQSSILISASFSISLNAYMKWIKSHLDTLSKYVISLGRIIIVPTRCVGQLVSVMSSWPISVQWVGKTLQDHKLQWLVRHSQSSRISH